MTETFSAFDEAGLQFAWNSTSIKAASTCLMYYKLTVLDGWTSKFMSAHLRFGAAYATALEHYYKHLAEGADEEEALERVVLEALVETWDREKNEPWESFHSAKTRANLIRTIVWYFENFRDDPMPVVQLPQGPAVELTFQLPVDDGLVFTGHIDRLVEYSGHKYVMDQKTTSSTISAYYWEQFKPHTQFAMYTFAGQAIYDVPVKGVLIDAAQIAVGFTKFERSAVMFSQPELHEWYDNSMYYIETARHATKEQHFPLNPQSCGNYGGCPFRSVCSRSPEVRPNFLAGDFEKGERLGPLTIR